MLFHSIQPDALTEQSSTKRATSIIEEALSNVNTKREEITKNEI